MTYHYYENGKKPHTKRMATIIKEQEKKQKEVLKNASKSD
jgi:hypothetical protein